MSKLNCGHAEFLKHIIHKHWKDLGKVRKLTFIKYPSCGQHTSFYHTIEKIEAQRG